MGRKQELSAEDVAAAITKSQGLMTVAARILRANPATVYDYINRYPICKQAQLDAREKMGDTAETKLFEAIKRGDFPAISLYLRTVHKQRGYVERQEVTGENGAPIQINVVRVDSRQEQEPQS